MSAGEHRVRTVAVVRALGIIVDSLPTSRTRSPIQRRLLYSGGVFTSTFRETIRFESVVSRRRRRRIDLTRQR